MPQRSGQSWVCGVLITVLAGEVCCFVSSRKLQSQDKDRSSVYTIFQRIEAVLTVRSETGKLSSHLVQGEFPSEQIVVGANIRPNRNEWLKKYPLSSGSTWMSRPKLVEELGIIHVTGPPQWVDIQYEIDDVLAGLKNFPNLECFGATFCPIDDSNILQIPTNKLSRLYLGSTRITNKGLLHVGKISSLEDLDLSDTPITSQGLKHLSKLTGLKRIHLAGTKIDDDCAHTLKKFIGLEELYVHNNSIGNEFLNGIVGCKEIRSMDLSNTEISDPGLVHLREFDSLAELHLNQCSISKLSVSHLSKCRNLKKLSLYGTLMNSNDIKELSKLLPNASILWKEKNGYPQLSPN